MGRLRSAFAVSTLYPGRHVDVMHYCYVNNGSHSPDNIPLSLPYDRLRSSGTPVDVGFLHLLASSLHLNIIDSLKHESTIQNLFRSVQILFRRSVVVKTRGKFRLSFFM